MKNLSWFAGFWVPLSRKLFPTAPMRGTRLGFTSRNLVIHINDVDIGWIYANNLGKVNLGSIFTDDLNLSSFSVNKLVVSVEFNPTNVILNFSITLGRPLGRLLS